jgi:hypothetical protein
MSKRSTAWLGGAAVVLVAAIVVTRVVWHAVRSYQPPPGANPPSVTDWMQGWAGIGGVAAGLAAAIFTGWLLVHTMRESRRARADAEHERAAAAEDRRRLAAERRDTEMAPARNVLIQEFAWAVEDGDMLHDVSFVVTNFGPGPILDAHVEISVPGVKASEIPVGVVAPNGEKPIRSDARHHMPGSQRRYAHTPPPLSAALVFTDMNGLRWRRTTSWSWPRQVLEHGQPERIMEAGES